MRFFAVLIFIVLGFSQISSQGIEFFHGSFEEAKEAAKKQDKIIFVDAYAEWCGPCKRMAKNVFPNEKVGDFYNKNFISMKLDMERGEGLKFRQKYPVSAFPTLFFIDFDGKVVQQVRGAQQVEGLINLGKKVLTSIDRSGTYAELYEKGDRDPELILNYVKALNKAHKPSLKISNDYLRSQKDLTTDFNLKFLYEAAVYADSRVFDLLIKHQKAVGQKVGLQPLKNRIELACNNTAKKSIEYESPELLEEAKEKMEKHNADKAFEFAVKVDMEYYKATRDHKNYLRACQDFAKKVANGNAKDLNKLAEDIQKNFGKDEKCMKQAEKFAKSAAETGDVYTYYMTYAAILYQNGKKNDAINAANKSLEMARDIGQGAEKMVQQFIKKLES